MRLRMLVLSALIITSALAPAAMGGGGWWSYIDLEGQHLGIGETLTARSEVSFWDGTAQEARRTDYFAYLVRGVDAQGEGGRCPSSRMGNVAIGPETLVEAARRDDSDRRCTSGLLLGLRPCEIYCRVNDSRDAYRSIRSDAVR